MDITYQEASVQAIKNLKESCKLPPCFMLLSLMRSVRWIHQTNHWTVFKTSNFREKHKILEDAYESLDSSIDGLAEKMVYYFGVENLGNVDILERLSKILYGLEPLKSSFLAEMILLNFADEVATLPLPAALNDQVMKICGDRVQIAYLLEGLAC